MEQTALIKEHCAAHSLQQEGRGCVLSWLLETEQRGILGNAGEAGMVLFVSYMKKKENARV
jgi:hypothetical protein